MSARTSWDRVSWMTLERLLGIARLSRLAGVSVTDIHRYRAAPDTAPPEVTARLRYLDTVIRHLSGSHSEAGVRRWFGRVRAELDGLAPDVFLRGDWTPADDGPMRVHQLAISVSGTSR